jgi:hypothetical protein
MAFDCGGGAGVGVARYVALALQGRGYSNVFTFVPSVRDCAEPIVVRQHEWTREVRFDDGTERGAERVRVYVCMDAEADAESTAAAVVRDLLLVDWGSVPVDDGVHVVSVDVGAPAELGRDGSGRWVRTVDVLCTVVRPCGEE